MSRIVMLIKARVKTGEAKQSIKKIADDCYEIRVREKPLANAANRRVVELLAQALAVPPARVRIIKGHHSPSKIVSVGGHK